MVGIERMFSMSEVERRKGNTRVGITCCREARLVSVYSKNFGFIRS